MPSFLDCRIDADAILADIEAIARIESPTSDTAGVNRVLDTIAGWFEGTGAMLERFKTGDDRFGDMLRVRCDPGRNEPGILVLSHVDTVHPIGTLAGPLPFRREGDKVYGPGVYDMKGGLVLAIAAFRQLARDKVTRRLPLTFLFNPDEEVGSVGSRKAIEQEGARHRYVLVTEPKRGGGKIVTERKGTGQIRGPRARPAGTRGNVAPQGQERHPRHGRGDPRRSRASPTTSAASPPTSAWSAAAPASTSSPSTARRNADLRVCDLEAAAEMERRFRALAASDADVEITVTGGIHRPPFVRGPHVDALYAKAVAVAERMGLELQSDGLSGGGSDGNFTAAKGIATLDGLGIDGDGAHTNHEHLLYSSIEPGTRLMQGLMETLE